MPGNKYRMHNLSSAHAFRFSRDNGVSMQWKQWSTDEAWSKPVQILSASEAASLKQWRPAEEKMEFPSAGRDILDWLGRLEAWCASQPAGSDYLGLHSEFTWLRAAVGHTLPGTYAPGRKVDDLVRDLRASPHSRPGTPGEQHREFPQDIVAQLYPSADMHIPEQDALVRIEGLTHDAARDTIRSKVLVAGSNPAKRHECTMAPSNLSVQPTSVGHAQTKPPDTHLFRCFSSHTHPCGCLWGCCGLFLTTRLYFYFGVPLTSCRISLEFSLGDAAVYARADAESY